MGNTKDIHKMIRIEKGDIVNFVQKNKIDAIVNAAHPTLRRGTGKCVDAAINKSLDALSRHENHLQELVKKEWKDNRKNEIIKCKRGDILVTSGDKLCKFIIHTVGPENDMGHEKPKTCSSSCINTLRSCYRKIILEVLNNKSIKTLAVPIISAGNYELDFELAFKVAISEVYNTLLEQKQQDPEMFELSKINKIYFVILDKKNVDTANNIYKKYENIFETEKRINVFSTTESQLQYLKEVKLYDSNKGYFSIAKGFRAGLICFRKIFFYTYFKDWFGKDNWESRRHVVEMVTLGKMLLPILALFLLRFCTMPKCLSLLIMAFIIYGLVDTITYLLELIVLADIQNPSANIIRSIIMLFLNYFESVFDIAVIGYVLLSDTIGVKAILTFAMLGTEIPNASGSFEYMFLSFLQSGIQFFFLSIAFAYFANHLRQKEFRTK